VAKVLLEKFILHLCMVSSSILYLLVDSAPPSFRRKLKYFLINYSLVTCWQTSSLLTLDSSLL